MEARPRSGSEIREQRRKHAIIQLPWNKAAALGPGPGLKPFILLPEKYSTEYTTVSSLDLVQYARSSNHSDSEEDGELANEAIQSQDAVNHHRSDERLRRPLHKKRHFSRAPAATHRRPTRGEQPPSVIFLEVDPLWDPERGEANIRIVDAISFVERPV